MHTSILNSVEDVCPKRDYPRIQHGRIMARLWSCAFGAVIAMVLSSCGSPADADSEETTPVPSTSDEPFGEYDFVEGLCDELDWSPVEQFGEIDPESFDDLESGHPGGYSYNVCKRSIGDVTFALQAKYSYSKDQQENVLASSWSINPTCAQDELETGSSWDMANFTVHKDLSPWHRFSCAQFLDDNFALGLVFGHGDVPEPMPDAEWEDLTADITIALADQARQLAKR